MTNEKKETPVAAVSTENIYRLNGRVPLGKAIPFGLQHVLAMFVSNLAPVLIVCSAALVRGSGEPLTGAEITQLLQCAMFAAGIGTCMQLYPIWKIGSRLPIVMGVSFTFLGSLLMICTNPELGYEGMIGAVILGGIFEGLVGLSAKYWKRFLTPVVSACVVIAIGYSLLSVGMDSWGGGNGAEDFGSWYHLLIGLITLVVCLVSRYLLKGVYKNLNILVGLIVGYIISALFTVTGVAKMINFSSIGTTIHQVGYFSLPKLVFFTDHKPVFDLGAFLTIAIVFLVSAAETTGATTAVATGALHRDLKMEELQGSLAVDGFSSAISGCFGCLPLTSFSQNVGLVTMTGVINRFTILMGALILILASLFPPLGAFFNSLPQAVLGGCTVMMFGSIMYEGIKMLKECKFDDRTMIIVSLSFAIGVGLTQTSGNFFSAFPSEVGDIFNGNAVDAINFCGFTDNKPVILIVGGSSGSAVINRAIRENIDKLLERFNVIHLCGKDNLDHSLDNKPGYAQYEYIKKELSSMLALADLVISRAGANAICELLALRKPNILIPLSAAASRGDQILNAKSFKKSGYSYVIKEEELSSETLFAAIDDVYNNKQTYIETMEKSNLTDSTSIIVGMIEELVNNK